MSGTISINNGPSLLYNLKNVSKILHTSARHRTNKGFNSSIGPLCCDRLCCDQVTILLTSRWNSILRWINGREKKNWDDSKLDNQINWWNKINSTLMTDDVYFIPNYVQITVKSIFILSQRVLRKTEGNITKFRILKSTVELNNKLLVGILIFKNKGTEFHFSAKGLIILIQYLEIYWQ
jgi:hypothetical protein